MGNESGEHPKANPDANMLVEIAKSVRAVEAAALSIERSASITRDAVEGLMLRMASAEARLAALEAEKRGLSLNTQRDHLEHAKAEVERALVDLDRREAAAKEKG